MYPMIRDLLGLMTLAALLLSMGCGVPAENVPSGKEESLWQLGSEAEPAKLVSAASLENSVESTRSQPPQSPGLVPAPEAIPSLPTSKGLDRPPLLSVTLRNGQVDGLPIGLFSDKTLLMRDNGSILFLETDQILGHRITGQPFLPQDLQPLIADLQAEFGNQYRIRSAAPYLVIAKPNRIATWCDRFDRIHHSIRLFCTTRGIPMRSLEFPLIAIVLGSRKEFENYAKFEQTDIPAQCVGYYSQRTNRIVLYENENSQVTSGTLETICHEATHQFAFNAGLHQRLAATPLWLMEGFAVQFEAPAYCNYADRDAASCWPASQRAAWETLKKDRRYFLTLCHQLIANDASFKSDTLNAYTAAWAMNSYLSQRRGRQYVEYLHRISSMKPFEEYSERDRIRDFSTAFGADIGILLRETIAHLEQMR
jgi:hypothetical protein